MGGLPATTSDRRKAQIEERVSRGNRKAEGVTARELG